MLVNEYGSVVGMAGLENVLEELVGPIQGAFDRKIPRVAPLADGTFSRSNAASFPLLDILLAEASSVAVPETEAQTAGGLILDRLGRLARPGTRDGRRPPADGPPRRPDADPQDPQRARRVRGTLSPAGPKATREPSKGPEAIG